MTALSSHLSDFYSVCESCGRSGYDRVQPEFPGDVQCELCLPIRLRVMEREWSWILDRWAEARAEEVPE